MLFIDTILAMLAILFGALCLFAKDTVLEIIKRIAPSTQIRSGEWETNLNLTGFVSILLGMLLLVLTLN